MITLSIIIILFGVYSYFKIKKECKESFDITHTPHIIYAFVYVLGIYLLNKI